MGDTGFMPSTGELIAGVLVGIVGGFILTVAVLTGVGQRKRGSGVAVCVLAAVAFPGTWIAWYLSDE